MSPAVTFTLDLEDLRSSPRLEVRVERVSQHVFDRLAELGVRGTVFVVGEMAREHPALIKRIAHDGHEIGLHALRHAPIGDLGPAAFWAETREGRQLLEDLVGTQVRGYRAPMMSLVPESSWAPSVLAELGFTYSSSVLPAPSPLYGWPGLPRVPFRWRGGLIELPCPLVDVLGVPIPYLGGTYLRLLPGWVQRYGLRRSPAEAVLWTYCHPWEFDPEEPFYVYEHGGRLASWIAWRNRRRMMARLEQVLRHPTGPLLGQAAEALANDPTLAEVDPGHLARTAATPRRWHGALRRRP